MFKPFAKEGAKLLGAGAGPTAQLSTSELKAALEATGDDALSVLADLLQSAGDPWGELIALRLAEEDDLAEQHFRRHIVSLQGGLPHRDLGWRHGVVAEASFRGTTGQLRAHLDALSKLRTAGRIEVLSLSGSVGRQVLEALSSWAPKSLRSLELDGEVLGLDALALPNLEHLQLDLNTTVQGLTAAKLPRLSHLWIRTRKAIRAEVLTELLEWPTLRKLRRLDFDEHSTQVRTLDDAGVAALLAAAPRLTPLKALWVELANRALSPAVQRAATSFLAPRRKRALKEDERAPEPWFDE